MANFGFCTGLPAGLILERFGPKCGSLSALIITTTGYMGSYLALIYPKEFGTSLFWLLATINFIAGKFIHYLAAKKTIQMPTVEISRNERIPHAGSCWWYCKIMVSSPFKLEITYCHSSEGNKWWCPFWPLKTPKMHCKSQLHKIGTITQNMPQTSNSLLSPTKSMVARGTNGNQGQTMMDLQSSETINHP